MDKLPAAGERWEAFIEQTSPLGAALVNKVTGPSGSIKRTIFLG